MAGLRVAIVGCGSAAEYHAAAYRKNSDVKLVAVFCRRENRGDKFAAKYGNLNIYTDISEMLGVEKPDIVSVCTPAGSHAEFAIKAMEGGANVLCEKPFASTIQEADMMIEAEKQTGKVLMPGFTLRFFNEMRKVKRLAENGELGKIGNLWFRKGKWMPEQKWYSDPSKTGGVAMDLASHGIDLLTWITGARVTSVYASSTGIYGKEIDDNIWINMKFDNGAIGVVGSSYSYPFFSYDFGLSGEKKAVRHFRGKLFIESVEANHTLVWNFFNYCLETFVLPLRHLVDDPFEKEINHFVGSIKNNKKPLIAAEEGRENLKIVLAAIESAKTDRAVNL